ncbi:MAG: hypothetical protein CME64_00315 [Halobacteriovoraceae bacterium]|nr:hypothetical protein [Halobacteriovoraceae bacterium]
MNVSELEQSLNSVMEKLSNAGLTSDREKYVNFLAQTYYFVCHSVPLLELAIRHSQNDDFIKRSLEHIKEESGHEKIALHDLKKLGANIHDYPEWNWTQNFYGRQYDLVLEDGEILLGYILALEGIAALGKKAAKQVNDNFDRGTKFVDIHVEEDQDHLEKVLAQIERSKVKQLIYINFHHTVSQYEKFLDLLSQVEEEDLKIAA